MELLGGAVQSPIKLSQDRREFFLVEFCNCTVSVSVYIAWPSVSSLNNIKLQKIKAVKNL